MTQDVVLTSSLAGPYVHGTTTAPASLYALPSQLAPVVVILPAATPLIVAERAPRTPWLRCVYRPTDGLPQEGWLPQADLSPLTIGDNPVTPAELPISEYAGHSSSDLDQLAAFHNRAVKRAMMPYSAAALAVLAIGFVFVWLMALPIPPALSVILPLVLLPVLLGQWRVQTLLADAKAINALVLQESMQIESRQAHHDLLATAAQAGGVLHSRKQLSR